MTLVHAHYMLFSFRGLSGQRQTAACPSMPLANVLGNLSDFEESVRVAEANRKEVLSKVRRVRSKHVRIVALDPKADVPDSSLKLASYDGQDNEAHRVFVMLSELVSETPASNKWPAAAMVMTDEMEKMVSKKIEWARNQCHLDATQ